MNPVGTPTPLYTVIMVFAVATGVALARWTQPRLGLGLRERLGIGLGAFCGGMIGAKLPFLLTDWQGLLTGQAFFENGKTIVFGIVGGYLGVELAKLYLGIKVKTGDSFAVPVAAAVAIGRLACFSAGCCRGKESSVPWAIDFGDGVRCHPAQLYEFAFHFTMCAILARLWKQGSFPGQLIKLYILTYLGYRFLSEFIRAEPVVTFGLTVYQWACLALVPVFLLLWIRERPRVDVRPSKAWNNQGGHLPRN